LGTAEFVPSVQKPDSVVRATLEKLTEAGLLQPHGTGRGRTYTLSANLYRKAGKKAEYIRQAGFAPIQQEQMVLNYIEKHGSIKRADVMDLCHITQDQAYKLLLRLKNRGAVIQTGERKGAVYALKC
jgi:ATP-dependent DNA helicase RecG